MTTRRPARARRRPPAARFGLAWLALAALACSLLAAPPASPVASTAAPVTLPAVSPLPPTAERAVEVLEPQHLSAGDPYAPTLGNRGYDVLHYTLRVGLQPGVEAVAAVAEIDLASTTAGLRQVALDFVGFDLDAVAVDGAPAAFGRLDEKLLVELPAALDAGATARLSLAYQGRPVQEMSRYVPFIDHLGLQFRPDHIFVVSEPDGARYWFPANDHPRDKATFRFEISVPPGLTGVANGSLVDAQPGAGTLFAGGQSSDLYVWDHPFPMAPYQATVAVGPYVRLDDTSPGGVALRSYVFAGDEAAFETYRRPIGEMVDFMAGLFGPYPFEAFGYVLVGGLGGALETQTMVVTDRDALSETILAHELAHQWFGDWVSLDSWAEMWRSEGLATYAAALWRQRDNPARLAELMAPAIAAGPQAPFPLASPPPGRLFSPPVYDEGALLFGDLRQQMGDDAFFAGLRDYVRRYGGGTASDLEFQAVMEDAAGRSLQAVFDRWLK